MARRRTYRRAAPRRRARRSYAPKRRRSSGGGSMKPIMDGFMAGIGGQIASKWLGAWGHPVATLAVGMFRHNVTLKTEGARELGIALGSSIPFIGGSGAQGTQGAFE